MNISRRGVLKAGLAAGAVVGTGAWRDRGEPGGPVRQPGSLPDPDLEHGGYYDPVPPPAAIPPDSIPAGVPAGESACDGFGRYGFWVPFALVSPRAGPFYVSHRVFDHASIKLVEARCNLPALTYRDASAMLDLRFPALAKPPDLAEPLQESDPASLACNVSGPGVILPPGSVTG
jgi:phospholipase C